jgi:dihydrofolate reductase
MSKASVFIATSLDGYIAREDGGIDWLPTPENDSNNGEDYGYNDFIKTIDAIVMGRITYELVLTFDEWYYGEIPLIVLTRKGVEIPNRLSKTVTQMSGEPQKIVKDLAQKGYHNLYIDGGKTIQGFLNAGLIDEMTITTIPVLIGSGIPLFGSTDHDIHFEHVDNKSYPDGLAQHTYKMKNP